jgi:hypothetical protein
MSGASLKKCLSPNEVSSSAERCTDSSGQLISNGGGKQTIYEVMRTDQLLVTNRNIEKVSGVTSVYLGFLGGRNKKN